MGTRGISELIIKVDDVERVADFYRDVVGLTPDETAPDSASWFWTGEPENSPRFAVNKGRASLADVLPFDEHSPIPEHERWKKAHFAFEVPDADLDAAVKRLKERDIPVFGPIDLDWMHARACYFWDPEGHLVEFWSPVADAAGAETART